MNNTKGLIKYEDKTYWVDLTTPGKYEVRVQENGNWRPVTKTEVDFFDLLEKGEIVGTEKSASQ
jgi:hypothetical protein